ncbi:MAG: nucleotidyltransferase, partial [Bacteroidales bacterium]
IGYRVGNTLSESGAVARGVSATDEEGYLTTVVERTHIERIDGKVQYKDETGTFVTISDNTPVSMNMWGFTPDYFDYSEKDFIEFLTNNTDNLKGEYFIPLMVNKLIQDKTVKLKVLDTPSKWFGVTYADDREAVVAKINALIAAGEYPEKLW